MWLQEDLLVSRKLQVLPRASTHIENVTRPSRNLQNTTGGYMNSRRRFQEPRCSRIFNEAHKSYRFAYEIEGVDRIL
jgi:hypothetical protein